MPPESTWIAQRLLGLQLAIAVAGTIGYCIYARSWRDGSHLLYDIPANLAVFAFIGQLLAEVCRDDIGWHWACRFGLFLAMACVAGGRDFLGWPISGHLSCVLAVAVAQLADPRLPLLERGAYWLPLPIVLTIRWLDFDEGHHVQTYYAVLFGLIAALPAAVVARLGSGL